MLARVSPAMQALSERSPDTNAHRQDEPYRRALTGMYARLAATLHQLTGGEAARHAVAPQHPYRNAAELQDDLRTLEASLLANHGAALARARLQPMIRVWLSSGHRGPAPEFGQARSSGGRLAGHGPHRGPLQRAG